MAAELGDEFDDNDDEGLDFMVTDAMSSSNKNRTINASDRLGQQMIGTDDDVDDNISIRNNNTTPTLKFHLKTYGCQMNVNDTFTYLGPATCGENKKKSEVMCMIT